MNNPGQDIFREVVVPVAKMLERLSGQNCSDAEFAPLFKNLFQRREPLAKDIVRFVDQNYFGKLSEFAGKLARTSRLHLRVKKIERYRYDEILQVGVIT